MDHQRAIVEQVRGALDTGRPLAIRAGNSKPFYGHPVAGDVLDVSPHTGITEYDPGELVISCRCGSLLSDIRAALAEHGQQLPFDPPSFGERATVGGTIACGLSGPGRPWTGSLRDYLLGIRLVNGAGEIVHFGGQVMKNVAGYDVTRLMAGSLGTLGVLLEASFKVLPRPAAEGTVEFDCKQTEAIRLMNEWSGRSLPVTGATWERNRLRLRLAGAASEIHQARERLGAGDFLDDSGYWKRLREHQLEFFRAADRLWRVSVPPATEPLQLEGECLIDWGGAQRWYRTRAEASAIREVVETAGGHATLIRGEIAGERYHPLSPGLRQLHQRIKHVFDPRGIFNPGRLYRDL